MKGHFIAFDGVNGAGKTSIMNGVCDQLASKGIPVYKTKQPTNTELGTVTRDFAEKIKGKSLACMTAADRYFNIEHEVIPAIERGQLVLSDRSILSAYLYNKMDEVDFEFTDRLYSEILLPSLIIVVEASWDTVNLRLNKKSQLTRYEKEKTGLEYRVIQESVDHLKRRGVKIHEISSETHMKRSVDDACGVILDYIKHPSNRYKDEHAST